METMVIERTEKTTIPSQAKVGTVSASEIADILRGEPYVTVSLADLNKQFGIDLINIKLDRQQAPKKVAHLIGLLGYLMSAAALPIFVAVMFGVTAITAMPSIGSTIAITMAAFVASMISFYMFRHVTGDLYDWLTESIKYKNAVCIVEDFDTTKVEIPYGAKLRYEEAVETKEFDQFLVCYPSLEELTDPAIVGVADDGSWKLIALWDKVTGSDLPFGA